jgi:serine/threonine-protein phosphatase 2A regulatory subunit B''
MRTHYFSFRFYYPQGKPTNEHCGDAVYQKISSVFQQFPNQQVPREKFDAVAKVCIPCLLIFPHCILLLYEPKFYICLFLQACQCPVYWKIPLFIAAGGDKLGYVEANTFIDFWKK